MIKKLVKDLTWPELKWAWLWSQGWVDVEYAHGHNPVLTARDDQRIMRLDDMQIDTYAGVPWDNAQSAINIMEVYGISVNKHYDPHFKWHISAGHVSLDTNDMTTGVIRVALILELGDEVVVPESLT